MAFPKRIRLSRAKGWKKPDGAIVVARPTLFGNPFIVGRNGTAQQCVHRYAILMCGYINVGIGNPHPDVQEKHLRHVRENLDKLRGHDLACWCRIGQPCHAHVLIALASEGPRGLVQFQNCEVRPSIYMRLKDIEDGRARAAARASA